VRNDIFFELLHTGEQQEIQKIVSSFSDRSTGKWWLNEADRCTVPGSGGEQIIKTPDLFVCLVANDYLSMAFVVLLTILARYVCSIMMMGQQFLLAAATIIFSCDLVKRDYLQGQNSVQNVL
jgi:hypothetical protein